MTTLGVVLLAVLGGMLGGALEFWLVSLAMPLSAPREGPRGPVGPPGPGGTIDVDEIVARVERQLAIDTRRELKAHFEDYLEQAKLAIGEEVVSVWLKDRPVWTVEEGRAFVTEALKRHRTDVLSDLVVGITAQIGRHTTRGNGGK
jgi:hypothetical protein